MSQNPDFEETSLFDLFPAEEKKTYRFRSRKTVPFQQHPHGRKNSGSMILQNRHNGSVTI